MWSMRNDLADPDATSYLFSWEGVELPTEADYRHVIGVFPPELVGARRFSFVPYGDGTGLLAFFEPSPGAYHIKVTLTEAIKTLNLFSNLGIRARLTVETGEQVYRI